MHGGGIIWGGGEILYINVSPWEVITLTRNKVEICGVDTAKLPVLTNAEMRELFYGIANTKRMGSKREIGQWQLKASAQCHSTFQQSRRICRRSVPSRLHRPHEGDR